MMRETDAVIESKYLKPAAAALGPRLAEPEPSKLTTFHATELGNAERIRSLFGDRIRFCHPWSEWFLWDGQRWRRDVMAEIVTLAKETIRRTFDEANHMAEEDKRIRLLRHCLSSERSGAIRGMLQLAASEPGIAVRPEEMDADPWLLNVKNGTLDLRTGTLGPHDRKHLITKLAPVVYDPNAECRHWLAFQDRIMAGDAELIDFKQRAAGYALTGTVKDKRSVFVHHGKGNNGKSTELDLLREMLGDYAGQVPIDSLMQQRNSDGSGPSPDIVKLRGLRMVVTSEPAEGQRLNESKLKYLTSMGLITGRGLNKDYEEFRQTWKFFLDCNHRPIIRGSDSAVWNRIGLVSFDVVIADEEIDSSLPAKLRDELPGILAWCVRGCKAWQERGMVAPARVRADTEGFRQDMDPIGRFVEECCVVGPYVKTRGKALYSAFQTWATANGEDALNATVFGRRIGDREGISRERDRNGTRYEGIGLQVEGGEREA